MVAFPYRQHSIHGIAEPVHFATNGHRLRSSRNTATNQKREWSQLLKSPGELERKVAFLSFFLKGGHDLLPGIVVLTIRLFFNHIVEAGGSGVYNGLDCCTFVHFYKFFDTSDGNKVQKLAVVLIFYVMNYLFLNHWSLPFISLVYCIY